MKYLIKTSAEIAALASLFNEGKTNLPSLGGKSLRDIFGANKEYNSDFFYSVPDLDGKLINNPDHPFYSLYFVPVYQEDVELHAPTEVDNLVDFDPTWRVA